ncbi:hypothetical protein HN51_053204 [Arachis hypogaea]|uniref:B-box zinc finger protein 32 n=1 Tax=Arachis ipaensis TaxID=130454 RepID=UPI0007AFD2A0|nr:B-box zinc finger protein 32 [Arachis ipaensis]XP_020968330.1 B-box zinc finger protein 32 [Arachis ipaensis]XP_025676611.1 B-box zinc finger protein 32 [Arachis hypogaea]
MKERFCELCKEKASLYCASDSAFLCWKCDATVHNANFLVARHRRRLLCFNCNSFAGVHISGASSRRTAANCRSCSPTEIHYSDEEEEEEEEDNSLCSSPPSSSSSSSACVSSSEPRAGNKIRTKYLPEKRIRTVTSSGSAVTTDDDDFSTPKQKRQRNNKKKNSNGGGSGSDEVRTASAKEYSVFAKWSEELGLGLNEGRRVSCVACRALRVWVRKWKGVGIPYKVGAATSFWLGLRFCGMTFENLRRLEEISGVPAKLILQAYAMLSRVFFFSQQQQTTSPFFHLQEGSDES